MDKVLCTPSGRERTFDGRWSHGGSLSARKMAEAGFFRVKDWKVDIAMCPYCIFHFSDWMMEDDPLAKHKTSSSSCVFLREFPSGNTGEVNEYDIVYPYGVRSCECGYIFCERKRNFSFNFNRIMGQKRERSSYAKERLRERKNRL